MRRYAHVVVCDAQLWDELEEEDRIRTLEMAVEDAAEQVRDDGWLARALWDHPRKTMGWIGEDGLYHRPLIVMFVYEQEAGHEPAGP